MLPRPEGEAHREGEAHGEGEAQEEGEAHGEGRYPRSGSWGGCQLAEIVGWAASALVITSLMATSIVRLRAIGLFSRRGPSS